MDKGYKQQARIDYGEVFAPGTHLETIHLFISLVGQHGRKTFQMDIKYTFLDSYLEEEVYGEQPLGHVEKGHEDKLLK